MAKLVEMDEHVTLARQMEEEDISGLIILFNRFTVNPEDVNGFLKAWTDDATHEATARTYLNSIAQRYCRQHHFR